MNCELCRSESCELCKTELWRYWEEKKEAMLPNLSRNSKELMGKTVTCRKNRQMIETLNATDKDCFPNIYKILEIPCISPLASTGAERVASGIRRLKTAYWSTVTDERERNLNLITVTGNGRNWYNKSCEYFYKKREKRFDAWFTTQEVL